MVKSLIFLKITSGRFYFDERRTSIFVAIIDSPMPYVVKYW